jgi:hypothetical protein
MLTYKQHTGELQFNWHNHNTSIVDAKHQVIINERTHHFVHAAAAAAATDASEKC